MQDRHLPRCAIQHRGDAKGNLQSQRGKNGVERKPRAPVRAAPSAQPHDHAKGGQQIAHDAVNELHQTGAFKDVAPHRLYGKRIGREPLPPHHRPVGIAAPRINARHQRADQDLQEREMQQPGGQAKQLGLFAAAGLHQIPLGAAQL